MQQQEWGPVEGILGRAKWRNLPSCLSFQISSYFLQVFYERPFFKMVRYYKLGRTYVIVKLPTVRKAWINNDIRKGYLMGLNKYIDITTPMSYSTLINKVITKPVNNPLHNHGMIPNILNKNLTIVIIVR